MLNECLSKTTNQWDLLRVRSTGEISRISWVTSKTKAIPSSRLTKKESTRWKKTSLNLIKIGLVPRVSTRWNLSRMETTWFREHFLAVPQSIYSVKLNKSEPNHRKIPFKRIPPWGLKDLKDLSTRGSRCRLLTNLHNKERKQRERNMTIVIFNQGKCQGNMVQIEAEEATLNSVFLPWRKISQSFNLKRMRTCQKRNSRAKPPSKAP